MTWRPKHIWASWRHRAKDTYTRAADIELVCNYCGERFPNGSSVGDLATHMRVHH